MVRYFVKEGHGITKGGAMWTSRFCVIVNNAKWVGQLISWC